MKWGLGEEGFAQQIQRRRRKWLLLEEKLSAKPTDEVCSTRYSVLTQLRRIRKPSTSSDPPAAGHLLLQEKAFGAYPVGVIDTGWKSEAGRRSHDSALQSRSQNPAPQAQMASPGGKLSSAARLKRNAGGNPICGISVRLFPGLAAWWRSVRFHVSAGYLPQSSSVTANAVPPSPREKVLRRRFDQRLLQEKAFGAYPVGVIDAGW